MRSSLLSVFLAAAWAADPGPVGPPSLDETMTKMADQVANVVPPADNAQALAAITQEGIGLAEKQAQSSEQNAVLENIVKTLVQARLDTHLYQGMCPRNYSQPCPFSWKEQRFLDGVIGCSASEPAAQGLPPACNSYNVSDPITAAEKSNIATACKVQWPCAACTRDFSNCPQHFKQTAYNTPGHCEPRPEYVGPCATTVDFRRTTDNAEKARWATRCFTKWPCHPE